jgi:hypothetical protein
MNLRDLTEEDMDLTVWRYMPLSKFLSLFTYQALWFSKLSVLEDQFEGMMPAATKRKMQADHHKMKKNFPPELHWQFDEMASRNENDSRELIVVNCWFIGESELYCMWEEYGLETEAVAIRSTVRQLFANIGVPHDAHATHMGRVSYINHEAHVMSKYEANQGHERAFIKDAERYQHEKELRIITLNLKSRYCIKPDGNPYSEEEIKGKNMNNHGAPGLYFAVRLEQLISELVVSPNAEEWFYMLISRIIELNKFDIPVSRSKLTNA